MSVKGELPGKGEGEHSIPPRSETQYVERQRGIPITIRAITPINRGVIADLSNNTTVQARGGTATLLEGFFDLQKEQPIGHFNYIQFLQTGLFHPMISGESFFLLVKDANNDLREEGVNIYYVRDQQDPLNGAKYVYQLKTYVPHSLPQSTEVEKEARDPSVIRLIQNLPLGYSIIENAAPQGTQIGVTFSNDPETYDVREYLSYIAVGLKLLHDQGVFLPTPRELVTFAIQRGLIRPNTSMDYVMSGLGMFDATALKGAELRLTYLGEEDTPIFDRPFYLRTIANIESGQSGLARALEPIMQRNPHLVTDENLDQLRQLSRLPRTSYNRTNMNKEIYDALNQIGPRIDAVPVDKRKFALPITRLSERTVFQASTSTVVTPQNETTLTVLDTQQVRETLNPVQETEAPRPLRITPQTAFELTTVLVRAGHSKLRTETGELLPFQIFGPLEYAISRIRDHQAMKPFAQQELTEEVVTLRRTALNALGRSLSLETPRTIFVSGESWADEHLATIVVQLLKHNDPQELVASMRRLYNFNDKPPSQELRADRVVIPIESTSETLTIDKHFVDQQLLLALSKELRDHSQRPDLDRALADMNERIRRSLPTPQHSSFVPVSLAPDTIYERFSSAMKLLLHED